MLLQDRDHASIASQALSQTLVCPECGHAPVRRRLSIQVIFGVFRLQTGPKCYSPLPKGMGWAPECLCRGAFHRTHSA
jgi:hypothetical protein